MIELRPHIGYTATGTKVTLPQDQIFRDGLRVGYVGHAIGSAICLITSRLNKEAIDEIKRVVEAARGGPSKKVAIAPEIEEGDV